jgi:hypothetical protein
MCQSVQRRRLKRRIHAEGIPLQFKSRSPFYAKSYRLALSGNRIDLWGNIEQPHMHIYSSRLQLLLALQHSR